MTELMRDTVAFVTGGGSGIGRAIATRLARDGMSVVVADIDAGGATSTVNELIGQGNRALAVHCDVSSEHSVEKTFG